MNICYGPPAHSLHVTNLDIYTLLLCTIGGVLVGLCAKYLGDYPKDLETSVGQFKRTKQFDDRHLVQGVVASLASLGFGAALGPEAALVSLVGGLSTWIGSVSN